MMGFLFRPLTAIHTWTPTFADFARAIQETHSGIRGIIWKPSGMFHARVCTCRKHKDYSPQTNFVERIHKLLETNSSVKLSKYFKINVKITYNSAIHLIVCNLSISKCFYWSNK